MNASQLYFKLKRKPRLKTKIVLYLYHNHRGIENAVIRPHLLRFCMIFDPEITDRKLRKIYSSLNVCSCEVGIFWPIRKREIEKFRVYLKKKALPLFNRFKRVSYAHKSLMSGEVIQGELF